MCGQLFQVEEEQTMAIFSREPRAPRDAAKQAKTAGNTQDTGGQTAPKW